MKKYNYLLKITISFILLMGSAFAAQKKLVSNMISVVRNYEAPESGRIPGAAYYILHDYSRNDRWMGFRKAGGQPGGQYCQKEGLGYSSLIKCPEEDHLLHFTKESEIKNGEPTKNILSFYTAKHFLIERRIVTRDPQVSNQKQFGPLLDPAAKPQVIRAKIVRHLGTRRLRFIDSSNQSVYEVFGYTHGVKIPKKYLDACKERCDLSALDKIEDLTTPDTDESEDEGFAGPEY